ncbi:carbohydrate sulfotransferase 4-like [Glandiceps talaboti]
MPVFIQEDTNYESNRLSGKLKAQLQEHLKAQLTGHPNVVPDLSNGIFVNNTGHTTICNVNNNTRLQLQNHAAESIRVLIHARMRTGSSVTGTLLNNHPDFYYVYEPGHMLVEDKRLNLYGDSFQNLESIRPDLVKFLHSIYTCNFTATKFYTKSLQKHQFMRQNSRALAGGNIPIKEKDLSRICSQRRHIVVKTVRLNNLILASCVLEENRVKIIHIVRDPRGMMLSRRNMQRLSKEYKLVKGSIVFDKKLKGVIKDYCQWVNENYKSATEGPEWIRNQYFLLRYEDLIDRPMTFVPRMFNFIGLPVDNTTVERLQSTDWWSGHGEAWRTGLTVREVLRVQELCPDVFNKFGYIKISADHELHNMNRSLVVPIENTTINPQYV